MSLLLSSSLASLFTLLAAYPAPPATLTIAAASDLAPLEPLLEQQFEKTNPTEAFRSANPGQWLRFVNAASGVLAQQIGNGAPYDLFLSANAQFIDRLGSFGKIDPASLRVYAKGRVGVLWRDKKHHRINDLTQDWVRFVALPNPKLAPYGAAAQQALEHAGIWKAVQPKVVYGENVRQTLQLFDSGNADAVLTAGSLLQGRNPDVLPAAWHQPILQKAGIVAASPNRAEAHKFLNFLLSPAAQAVFAQFGFSKP